MTETELSFDEIISLHAFEEFGSVLADAPEKVEGGTGCVALDVEFGLDRTGENGVGDGENGRRALEGFEKGEVEQHLEVNIRDTYPEEG